MKEFIGYEKIIEGFFRRVDNGTLSHAHLIIGPNGIGKSILARIFALKILNKEKDIDGIISLFNANYHFKAYEATTKGNPKHPILIGEKAELSSLDEIGLKELSDRIINNIKK